MEEPRPGGHESWSSAVLRASQLAQGLWMVISMRVKRKASFN